MDPQQSFCPNPDCPARGHTGRGNIKIHCRRRGRHRCTECNKTFSARRGTPFYHAKTAPEIITQVLTLIAYGCPVVAIEAAFSLQRRTVRAWIKKAGDHCRTVHEHLVLQPQVLQHVQVDEIFVRKQGRRRFVFLFSALCVSTRLWLGGLLSQQRNKQATRNMAQMVRKAAFPGPLLIVCDGFSYYGRAFRQAFKWSLHTGRPGRPNRFCSAALVVIAHVKQRRMVRLVEGSWKQFALLWRSVGAGTVTTSYIERLNGTFRERLRLLVRRSRHLARTVASLEAGLYLLGSVYNFCSEHGSLCRTPAMAAGLVRERWNVGQLLGYRVPPERWRPPRHRGPLSKRERALLAQWGT